MCQWSNALPLHCVSSGSRLGKSDTVPRMGLRARLPAAMRQGSVRGSFALYIVCGLFLYLFKTLSLSLFIGAYLAKPTVGLL